MKPVRPATDENSFRPTRPGLTDRLVAACRGPAALRAFFGVSFLESSLLPVPIDLAMVPLGIAQPGKIWLIALIGTLGSVAGALLAYVLGAFAFDAAGAWMIDAYGMRNAFEAFQVEFEKSGWVALFLAAITPVPFKFAALLSGAMGMRIDTFLLVVFGSRLLRFGLMAATIRIFGSALQIVMGRHSKAFTIAAIAATLGGILLAPLLI